TESRTSSPRPRKVSDAKVTDDGVEGAIGHWKVFGVSLTKLHAGRGCCRGPPHRFRCEIPPDDRRGPASDRPQGHDAGASGDVQNTRARSVHDRVKQGIDRVSSHRRQEVAITVRALTGRGALEVPKRLGIELVLAHPVKECLQRRPVNCRPTVSALRDTQFGISADEPRKRWLPSPLDKSGRPSPVDLERDGQRGPRATLVGPPSKLPMSVIE